MSNNAFTVGKGPILCVLILTRGSYFDRRLTRIGVLTVGGGGGG